jgi:ribosomal protein S16
LFFFIIYLISFCFLTLYLLYVYVKSLLVCRLQRLSYSRYPTYRIILTFNSNAKNGIVFMKLGYLSFVLNNKIFFIDFQLLSDCLNKGIKISIALKQYISNFIIN